MHELEFQKWNFKSKMVLLEKITENEDKPAIMG